MERIFINIQNNKTNEPHRFKLTSTDQQINLILKIPIKKMALVNLSIYYTWKNIKSVYNNNNFKISAPTWYDEFNFCLTDPLLFHTFKVILSTLIINMKL